MDDRVDTGNFAGIGSYPTVANELGEQVPAPIKLLGCEDEALSREHMAAVQDRYAFLATPEAAVQMRSRMMDVAAKASNEHRIRLINTANKAGTVKKRIHWLRQEADLIVRAASASSACSAGCSACCHMAVAVSEQEARVIAQEQGLELREPPAGHDFTFDLRNLDNQNFQTEMAAAMQSDGSRWNGKACPFLSDEPGRGCSIYSPSRPLSCRNLINLDRDDLLCKLVEGAHIRVPYLNRTDVHVASMLILGPSVRVADIRDWFGTERLAPAKG